MRRYAQELTDDVVFRHVDLYVNDWTTDVGDIGRAALEVLDRQARRAGVVTSGTAPTPGVLDTAPTDRTPPPV